MGTISNYFRQHPWQRRAVTATIALAVGAGVALLAYPAVQDYFVIRDLGSDDPAVRAKAVIRATASARGSEHTLTRLNDAMATDSDVRFAGIVTVLRRMGKFNVPRRDPLQIDRMRTIEITTTYSPTDPVSAGQTRSLILTEVILSGRDNRYVRRALSAALRDESPAVRRLSGVLAARLKDDKALAELLGDKEPAVKAAAVLDAALAGRKELAQRISELLAETGDLEVVSAAAYAMAILQPAQSSARICGLLSTADDAALRDRLLHVMTLLDDDNARKAVQAALESFGGDDPEAPPAAALLAAGKLAVEAAGPYAKAVLAQAVQEGVKLRESQLLAAMYAADRLALPVRSQIDAICRKLWGPYWPLTLTAAARLLGRQVDVPQGEGYAGPSRAESIKTLQRAAVYKSPASTQPATTPVPSAAAAVALWMLDSAAGELFVRNAAASKGPLAGEYIARHIAAAGKAHAFDLGLAMLPAPTAPPHLRVYNDNERAAGAMLLALSARSDEQREIAIRRIESRLAGGPPTGEDRFEVASTYRCALLALGRDEFAPVARELLAASGPLQRRALTALLAAGRREALDWLLCNSQTTNDQLAELLVDAGLGEVLAATATQLPAVDVSADPRLLDWQISILRDYYMIHRDSVRIGLRP